MKSASSFKLILVRIGLGTYIINLLGKLELRTFSSFTILNVRTLKSPTCQDTQCALFVRYAVGKACLTVAHNPCRGYGFKHIGFCMNTPCLLMNRDTCTETIHRWTEAWKQSDKTSKLRCKDIGLWTANCRFVITPNWRHSLSVWVYTSCRVFNGVS